MRQERFPEFLGYHLRCELPRVLSQRLFKLVRARVRDGPGVFALLQALERRAEVFAALFGPQHAYWIEQPDSGYYERDLNVLRARQMTPLAFGAWETMQPADFARLLKRLVVVIFRYGAVGGLLTNALEEVFRDGAKGLLDGRLHCPREVFGVLRPI